MIILFPRWDYVSSLEGIWIWGQLLVRWFTLWTVLFQTSVFSMTTDNRALDLGIYAGIVYDPAKWTFWNPKSRRFGEGMIFPLFNQVILGFQPLIFGSVYAFLRPQKHMFAIQLSTSPFPCMPKHCIFSGENGSLGIRLSRTYGNHVSLWDLPSRSP